jgi:peptidoglycan hydrolase-like protein with peptidoglycan-binding domain
MSLRMRVLTHRVLPKEAKAVKKDLAAISTQLKAGNALNLGDTGKAVAALQRQLKSAGLYNGPVSASFDADTATAVAALQKAKGLEASGIVGGKTLKAIKSTDLFVKDGFVNAAKVGQRGSDIHRAERMLEKLGFRPGKVDGIMDKATANAVERYRKADGQVPGKGHMIGKKFYSELANASRNYNHTPFSKRQIGGIKQHNRLDALTAKAAGKGEGIGPGAKGRAVLNVEKHLEAAGYELGAQNSTFGSRTGAAVKAFQRNSGLRETGVVDARTWGKLKNKLFAAEGAATPPQRLGERDGAVKNTEKKLKFLGFNPGAVDGTFSKSTAKAVKAFQKRKGIKRSGAVGSSTMRALDKAVKAKKSGGPIRAGGGWGGSQNVVNAAKRIAGQLGIPVTSQKRSLADTIRVGSSTASDHFTGNSTAFATDFGVSGSRGDRFARAVAKKYGIPQGNIGTFNRHIINVGGKRYSLQLLWRVEGHFDHVHLGVRRA